MEQTPIWNQMVKDHGDPFKNEPLRNLDKPESQTVKSPKAAMKATQRAQPKKTTKRKR